MKFKSLFLLVVVFTLFSFSGGKSKLNGTWKLVSQDLVRNGQSHLSILEDVNGSQLKTWSDKHFMFVGNSFSGNQLQQSFGGGTYDLSKNIYTETVQYHNVASFRGQKVQQFLEIKGDTLYQIFPFGGIENYDENNCNIEKYIRLD
ncbi:hypothetical protein [Sunxiuqinia dokdonensis]|uniref:Lipocalin-like domain-containing protein n=1 Tax=Sunxiuqinia dokdonensis TaxID=1409788 RepID=A0A0L8V446_9BACT|nr:hypothetical protein [Sunxiuqinia dokdonensis]KOH43186.1 hypothetical protein NC99_40100 [Sunxiuqinia dokdonensis]